MNTRPILALITLFMSLSSIVNCSSSANVEHRVEELSFQSGTFKLVGELRLPVGHEKYTAIMFVHGDGHATSTEGGYYFPAMERCLKAGFACFSYHKPGCGRSTGDFDETKLEYERSRILLDAIALLKNHPGVDQNRIGLWGISQAGYVMPMALRESDDVACMIAVSCAAEDGVEQSAYLVGRQVKCAGYADSVAVRMEQLFSQVCKAQSYADYAKAAEQLTANPAVPRDMIAGVLSEDRWSPRDSADEGYFDPMEIIEQTTIPVLAIFGEKDTQVDPIHGKTGYDKALRKGGNKHSRVVLVAGADHSMAVSETGCMEERRKRSGSGWLNQSPEYLDILEEWLRAL